jgi:hypothetical protein
VKVCIDERTDGADSHGVNTRLSARLPRCGFPYARLACLVIPRYLLELYPFRFVGRKRLDVCDFGRHGRVVGGTVARSSGVEGACELACAKSTSLGIDCTFDVED